ncbi:TIGR02677 family protein [Natronospora cellulosivora (SeqCode)]
MNINSKLTKPLVEVKYLNTDNSWRYRPILRYFYEQYEKIKYWMYKEEVFQELKKHEIFKDYTMEQCKQDLDVLLDWGNLVAMQDTSKSATIEEFRNKQFRYQLSEYSVEIERMTIKLENIFVEGASLEPTLLERIKDEVQKFSSMAEEDLKVVGLWWRDLNTDFKRLNQNYQDYIRSFYSIKAEEMMRTREFIAYKDAVIDYLREFVKELQKNLYIIEETIKKLSDSQVEKVLKKAWQFEKSIPRLENEVTDQDLEENIAGRWKNFRDWFLGSGEAESEAVKLFEITNEIIRKITRFASQIIENRNSAANRKEEYRKLCELFLDCQDMDEANKLSSLSFGIFRSRHIKANINRETESINSGIYDEAAVELKIKPRVRRYREKRKRIPIEDKSKKKKKLLKIYIRERKQEQEVIDSYIQENIIDFSELPLIPSHVRITLLKWIGKATASHNNLAKTEDGREFKLIKPVNEQDCILRCEDGNLTMPAYKIMFLVENIQQEVEIEQSVV